MPNWNKLKNESVSVITMAVLCREYVLFDEEFSENTKIKARIDNAEFWAEMAHNVLWAITQRLRFRAEKEEWNDIEYDENGNVIIAESVLMDYIMSQKNRLVLNDLIESTIESWIKHFN